MELCSPKSIKLQIGTKPLSNLLVFQNSKHKNNISQTDYGSNSIFLNDSDSVSLFGSFLKEASSALISSKRYTMSSVFTVDGLGSLLVMAL